MTEDDMNELGYLRFFFDAVRPVLGPADDDIIGSIEDQWVEKGNRLPNRYKRED